MAEKILIVDDEPDLELLINQRFRKQIREGIFEFVYALNGQDALEKLYQFQEIRLIMTDINMPVMDGLELLERLKESEEPCKVIVVSAYGDLRNIRTAMNRGAFDFVTKPIDFIDFEATISKSLYELDFIHSSIKTKKQLEQEHIERTKAEHKEKMEQQFLANMSHEIRTPLNAIHGMSKLLLMREQPPENKTYLQGIAQSCDNLIVIINDILDLSKIQAGKIEFEKLPLKPAEILELILHMLQFKADEKKISLTTSVSNNVPQVLIGDPTRLSQVLVNLVSNAIKFTEKGSIHISCDAEIIVEESSGENTCDLKFAVRDTGIGMTEEQLGKIFQSFTQASTETTRKYGGTGLGLTISKQLVELQGGKISVESKPGSGSVFSFFIPLRISENAVVLEKEESTSISAFTRVSTMKILLVEDNEFNQMVAIGLLGAMAKGVTIDCALNGSEAIEKVFANNYDVVLMDIQMPVMDGLEATREIRNKENNIPIVAMTAGTTKEEVQRIFDSGANDFVPKPFNPEELILKISKLVN